MPDEQLTNDDWLELYRYLLAQLEERGYADVRAEIEMAAAAPVFEESTPDEDVRISRITRGKVGRATMRPRSPAELFDAGLEVLRARLIELPAVAEAIPRHLGIDVGSIEFRLDAPTQSDPVLLARLLITPADIVPISEALMRLGVHAERMKGGR